MSLDDMPQYIKDFTDNLIKSEYYKPDSVKLLHFICIVVLSVILHDVITAAEANLIWAIAPISVFPIISSNSIVPIVVFPS